MNASGVRFMGLGPLVETYGKRQPAVAAIDFALADGRRRRPDLYNLLVDMGERSGDPAAPSWMNRAVR